MLLCWLEQCFGPLNWFISKWYSETGASEHSNNHVFGMDNFGHIQFRAVISFSKCSKFYADFENAIKPPQHVDGFEGKWAWSCCGSFCESWQDYMWWAVKVLKSCPKISDPTKRDDTQLNLFHINETLVWKCCRTDLRSALDPLTSWFQEVFWNRSFREFK